jgi:hypothetical protein
MEEILHYAQTTTAYNGYIILRSLRDKLLVGWSCCQSMTTVFCIVKVSSTLMLMRYLGVGASSVDGK